MQLQRMEGEIGIAHGSDRELWTEDLVNALYCCVSGQELVQNLQSSAQTSLNVAGLQMAQMQDQQARITSIQAMAASASGQMQAL